ncbi:acyl-homoserine-lactone synthase [Neoaquamicrobium sediminum]|uniref:acyl-homoserine-lactone synthase n=1 Tax=Neoaquamicrobium sediminum TaxID=1849104 RepID=UPI00156506A8|nr:acyl-homoserine-lactone synthase [Mesorhizobium sediminum]NRC57204.1 hypothetical protein [Mesorhizobium sediminum]
MIRIIEGVDRELHPELMDEMFRMRAAVFAGRLGWDVTVKDGREADRFDAEDPLYLFSLNEETEEMQGAVRLLPTTGPYMLRDVFSLLVPDGAPESPLIWESSRFAVNPSILTSGERAEANHIVNRTTIELLCGIVEVCQKAGVEHIVSVFDARMARIFRSADCPFDIIGTPTRIGKTMTYAGLFDMTNDMRRRLGSVGGLPYAVLATHRSQPTGTA